MKYVLGTAAALSTLFVTQALADDEIERGAFLCISEKAIGFKVKDGEWREVNFTTGRKYIVRPQKEGDKLYDPSMEHRYVVFDFGDDFPSAWDDQGFGYFLTGEYTPSSSINAKGYFSVFSMDKETLRYAANYRGDWTSQSPDAEQTEGNDIAIEIGSCTRL